MMWCMSERTVCDFQRGADWRARKSHNRGSTSTARRLERDKVHKRHYKNSYTNNHCLSLQNTGYQRCYLETGAPIRPRYSTPALKASLANRTTNVHIVPDIWRTSPFTNSYTFWAWSTTLKHRSFFTCRMRYISMPKHWTQHAKNW